MYPIGNTPMTALPCPRARLLGKWEAANPAGSVKDRAAFSMMQAAPLGPGCRILEATSGNTGIALAALAAAKGFRCTIVMPENMSRERQLLIRAYGAELVLTPADAAMAGAVAAARKMAAADSSCFYVNQFENPANPLAHYRTTGPEIWAQAGETVDIFVAGVGTGGTVTGVGRYLKEKNPAVQIVAVAPVRGDSIPGIGAGFPPPLLDRAIIDRWITVTAPDALTAAGNLAKTAGLLPGPSGGAALHAAYTLAALPENEGKTMVVLLPDSGERYLSMGL